MENKTDTPKTTVREKYNSVVENFISKLENNDIEPWTKSWSTDAGLPKNFESSNHYQGMNILTLLDKGFKDSRWLTFNQIKKLDGSVIQGEKSSPVFFLKALEKEEINEETQEIEKKKYFIMKSYNVFNIEQTKGIEYKTEAKVDNANSDIQTFIDSFEIEVYPGAPAYSPKDDCIFMPSLADFDSNQNEYYSTFFHELTHSTGHKDRLDRFEQNTTFGDEEYAYEELIAELGSAFLSLEHNIQPNSKKQAAYLKSWITALKEKPQILYSASSQASRSTNYLLEQYKIKQELKVQQGVDYNINLTKIIDKENQPSLNNNNNPSPLAS